MVDSSVPSHPPGSLQYAVGNYVTMYSVPHVVVDGQAKGGRDVIGGGMAAGPMARRLMY